MKLYSDGGKHNNEMPEIPEVPDKPVRRTTGKDLPSMSMGDISHVQPISTEDLKEIINAEVIQSALPPEKPQPPERPPAPDPAPLPAPPPQPAKMQTPENLSAPEDMLYPEETEWTEEEKRTLKKVLGRTSVRKHSSADKHAKADELYEFQTDKGFEHLEPPKKSAAKVALTAFIITLLTGVLGVGGWYYWWTEYATFDYELKPVVILDSQSVSPNDFLPASEIQRGVNAVFKDPRFAPLPGHISVPIILEFGLRSLETNANLYVLTPETERIHEYRSPAPDLSPMDFISNSYIVAGISYQLDFAQTPPSLDEFDVGVYKLQLALNGTPFEVTLTVEDTVAPIATPQDKTVQIGETVTPEDFVTDVFDHSEIAYISFTGTNEGEVVITALSDQIITIEITDIYGNTEEFAGSLTVLKNEHPPIFTDLPAVIELMADKPLAFPGNVTVTDDFGREIDYFIDDSGVDNETAGQYTVTYIAEDFTGLRTEVEVPLYIISIDPAEVDEWIDEKLAEIFKDNMTQEEKVRAIFETVRKTITYSTTTGTEWTGSLYTAAHYAIKNPRGDYYHFYSLSELMLTRAGIESIRIDRSEDTKSGKPHIWNLIYYDDSGWYHYDSTNITNYTSLNAIQHKFTQKQAAEIEKQMSQVQSYGKEGFYDYDTDFYPDIVPE